MVNYGDIVTQTVSQLLEHEGNAEMVRIAQMGNSSNAY